DAVVSGEILNTDLSQNFNTQFVYNNGGIGYHKNGDKSSFSAVLNLQSAQLDGEDTFDNFSVSRNFLNLLPRINWRYELGTAHNIFLRYSTNINEPSLTQLQPTVDNSNPLNIYQGNPDLRPEYRHRINARYFKFDQFSFTNFFAFINATYTTNKIINAVNFENGIQSSQPVNVDSDLSLSTNLNFSTPLKFIGAKMELRTRFAYTNRDQFINRTQNKLNRYTNAFTARFGNRKKEKIDFEIGGTWSYNNNRYSINSENNIQYLNQSYFTELIANLGERFAFETSFNYDIFSAQSFGESLDIPIWKAEISHFFLNGKKGEIKLAVFDILDQNKGLNRVNNLNYVEQERIVSLGRFFMLSFTYSIKGFGNKKEGRSFRFRR
ncbi:MAG: TonB-dependent receptor, partial [Bacteroidota bacterium]